MEGDRPRIMPGESEALGTCAQTRQLHDHKFCREFHTSSAHTWIQYVVESAPTSNETMVSAPGPARLGFLMHGDKPEPLPAGDYKAVGQVRDMTKEGAETKEKLGGGATRTKSPYRFDLIPAVTNRRAALRYGQGAIKHGEGNWQGGDWTFVVSCVNHLNTHCNTMILEEGNEKDDNIGAMLWNVHAIGWYEANKPEEFKKALAYLNRGVKPYVARG